MCFVFIWEQTAICATYSINWLVFITEVKSVYCAVRTGSLNKEVCASSLKGQFRLQQSQFHTSYLVYLPVIAIRNIFKIHLTLWFSSDPVHPQSLYMISVRYFEPAIWGVFNFSVSLGRINIFVSAFCNSSISACQWTQILWVKAPSFFGIIVPLCYTNKFNFFIFRKHNR